MPPKPADLTVPGPSHTDGQGALDSPSQTRSGRAYQSIPPTPARPASESQAQPSASSASGPPPPSNGQIVTGGPDSPKQTRSGYIYQNVPPTPAGPASKSQAQPSASSSSGPLPPSNLLGSVAQAGQVAQRAIASSGSPDMAPASSITSDDTALRTTPQALQALQADSQAEASSSRAPPATASSAQRSTSQTPQELDANLKAEASSSPAPLATDSSAQRDSTPIGGILWSDVKEYLRTRRGPPPKVLCLFCSEEVIIDGLQAPGDGREPCKTLPCGHIFGEHCINRWMAERTYNDELEGPVSAPCPTCRRAASSGREVPPPQILGRRRRLNTSASASRPPRQRPRHRSPPEHIMQDADDGFEARPELDQIRQGQPRQPGQQGQPGQPGQPGRVRREPIEIVIRDPEKRNDQGEFVESRALVLGGLAMRGKMAVELPSENPAFPSYLRRYMVKCKDYQMKWGILPPLQKKRDLKRLKDIAKREREEGYWVPEVIGIISSPQYATEVQATPFHVLKLRLPENDEWNDEWHSKSDAFAAFGDLTTDMKDYWEKSGQKEPTKPREAYLREHLQHLGAQQVEEGTLAEVDNAMAAVTTKLLRDTLKLRRQRLAARQRPEHETGGTEGDGRVETDGPGVGGDADMGRGRSRTRRPHPPPS